MISLFKINMADLFIINYRLHFTKFDCVVLLIGLTLYIQMFFFIAQGSVQFQSTSESGKRL